MLLLGEENCIQIVLITVPSSLLIRTGLLKMPAVSSTEGILSTVPGPLPNLGFWGADSAGTRQLLMLLRKSVIAQVD